ATGCLPLPNRPWSSAPVPLLDARRSPIVDTAADGRSTSTPARVPTVPAPPDRARSDGSVLRPARCSRTSYSSVSCVRAGQPRNWRARTPAPPRHPHLASATHHGIVHTRFLWARVGAFVAADDRAERDAPVWQWSH